MYLLMAELIPSLTTCLSRMTAGEKRFGRRLEQFLEDDYVCWYDIPVGNKRRYPDFIVLHPRRGLLFLEVKDWKPESMKQISHQSVELLTDSGRKTVANPVEQARQCAYQVVDQLKKDATLVEIDGRYQGNLCFPYGYGVVFTNITRRTFEKGIPAEIRERVLPDHLILCKDEMTEGADPESFQQRLWGMFNYSFGQPLSLPQIDRIRWHLFPEVRIDQSPQASLFASGHADQPLQAELPDLMRIMDIQQEQLARSLGDGHRVIHGVAGSGKTLILGYRCLHLAQTMCKPILVLCFNITLAARLRSFIAERGISERVHVYHFHDWCGEQIRTYQAPLPDSDAPHWEKQVAAVIDGVEKSLVPRGQYGALLIDEGHDFQLEWLSLVSQMVDPETNSLLLLYDDAQSIYRKRSSLKFSLASVGIQAQGRTTILKLNYRNSREILEFAYRFAQDYFDQSGDDEIPLVKPESAGSSGTRPVVRMVSNLDAEISDAIACIRRWVESGRPLREIAVLYPGSGSGKQMHQALKAAQIPVSWLATSQYKKKYDPESDHVALMPLPSSKGLEFEAVILLDASFQQRGADTDPELMAEDVRRLYVGLTRARKELHVSCHRENVIAESLISCDAGLHSGSAINRP